MLPPLGKRILLHCQLLPDAVRRLAAARRAAGARPSSTSTTARPPRVCRSASSILPAWCSASPPASCCSTISRGWFSGRPANPIWWRSREIGGALHMTIAVFAFSLLGAMALGMPIAFALIICGVALMTTIGHVRFPDRGAEHHQRRRQLSADGDPVLHAGRRDHEQGRAGEAHRQCRPRRRRPSSRRARLRHHSRGLHPGVAVGIRRGRCRGACGAAGADDGGGRPQQGACGGAGRRRRHHCAGDPAQHRFCHLRRRRRRLDLQAVPRRNRAGPDARAAPCAWPGGGWSARRT